MTLWLLLNFFLLLQLTCCSFFGSERIESNSDSFAEKLEDLFPLEATVEEAMPSTEEPSRKRRKLYDEADLVNLDNTSSSISNDFSVAFPASDPTFIHDFTLPIEDFIEKMKRAISIVMDDAFISDGIECASFFADGLNELQRLSMDYKMKIHENHVLFDSALMVFNLLDNSKKELNTCEAVLSHHLMKFNQPEPKFSVENIDDFSEFCKQEFRKNIQQGDFELRKKLQSGFTAILKQEVQLQKIAKDIYCVSKSAIGALKKLKSSELSFYEKIIDRLFISSTSVSEAVRIEKSNQMFEYILQKARVFEAEIMKKLKLLDEDLRPIWSFACRINENTMPTEAMLGRLHVSLLKVRENQKMIRSLQLSSEISFSARTQYKLSRFFHRFSALESDLQSAYFSLQFKEKPTKVLEPIIGDYLNFDRELYKTSNSYKMQFATEIKKLRQETDLKLAPVINNSVLSEVALKNADEGMLLLHKTCEILRTISNYTDVFDSTQIEKIKLNIAKLEIYVQQIAEKIEAIKNRQ